MKKIIIAYVPVLHDGYRQFLRKHKNADILYLFDDDIVAEFYYLQKDIRALPVDFIKKSLETWGLNIPIEILTKSSAEKLSREKVEIIMPDEDVCHELQEKYFKKHKVKFDSIFLRWDKHNAVAEKPVIADSMISRDAFDRTVIKKIEKEAEKSSDFWRHVGAAIIKNGKIISVAHNSHVPSEHMPYVNGDPRNAFKKGINIDTSTVLHAEARLIAEAAQKGISLDGALMYVTTFPCPTCAKFIAYSGIKKLYASGGYAVLDGESILKARDVKIIFVESDKKSTSNKKWRGYSKK